MNVIKHVHTRYKTDDKNLILKTKKNLIFFPRQFNYGATYTKWEKKFSFCFFIFSLFLCYLKGLKGSI